jgi:hypothetical protein
MFTPFDSYFLNQAERLRTRAEELAEDRRAAELAATLAQGRRSIRRAWDRAVRKR